MVIFLGDDTDEIFDRIGSHGRGSVSGMGVSAYGSGSSTRNDDTVRYSYETRGGITTMRFLDDACVMVLSNRETTLTLADGRQFTLDGITPLWLRCKPDGTVIELNELPAGFVEFFESPPANPGLGDMRFHIISYPEAFRRPE